MQIDPDIGRGLPRQGIALGAQREDRQRLTQPCQHGTEAVAPLAIGAFLPQQRDQLAAALANGSKTRAQVLREIVEDADLVESAEFRRAFVLAQYFGYMRRNPNDTPDSDHGGYDFWLTKLNDFNGNFVNAEMVKAFILSDEYRHRFGP